MGSLVSKGRATNELNNMINASLDILNQTTQNCYKSAANVQGLSFRNVVGNINLEHFNWSQMAFADGKCVASMATSVDTKQAVSSKLTQIASAIVGSLSLGSSDANNLMNSTLDLSQHIVNAFAQTCTTGASNSQTIALDGVVGNITIGYMNFDQVAKVTGDCVQNSVMNTKAAQDIKQIIDQSASAKNEGLLDFLKYIAIMVVAVIAVLAVGAIFVLPKLLGDGGGGAPAPSPGALRLAALAV